MRLMRRRSLGSIGEEVFFIVFPMAARAEEGILLATEVCERSYKEQSTAAIRGNRPDENNRNAPSETVDGKYF